MDLWFATVSYIHPPIRPIRTRKKKISHIFSVRESLCIALAKLQKNVLCSPGYFIDDGLVRQIPPWREKADDSMNFSFQIFKFALRLISQQINDGFSNIAIGYLDM